MPDPARPSDAELLAAYAGGSRAALDALVHRHLPAVYGFLFRLLGSKEDAEDACQEAFLRAWKHRSRYRQGEPLKAWLFAIARNCAYDLLRKKRRPLVSLDAEADDDSGATAADSIADDAPLPDEIVAGLQDKERVDGLLQRLPPETREILLLHYGEGFAFREIGELLGKPLDTVKSQHRQALLRLRSFLAPSQPAPKSALIR